MKVNSTQLSDSKRGDVYFSLRSADVIELGLTAADYEIMKLLSLRRSRANSACYKQKNLTTSCVMDILRNCDK